MKQTVSAPVRRALLWKEWREQRWRGILSVIVLATLAGGLIRAQILTLPEATVLVFVPASIILAIFLAMGTVATEREDGTWPFLRSQPVSAAVILRAKWRMSAAILIASFLIAAFAAYWAARSRGLFDLPPPPARYVTQPGFGYFGGGRNALLWTIGVCLAGSLALHAVLVAVLSRARSELHAGIGGILVTIVAIAWLLQGAAGSVLLPGGEAPWQRVFRVTYTLSPLSPLASYDGPSVIAIAAIAAAIAWVVCSVTWIDRFAGERR